MQILTCSHNDFLMGILQSYAHVVGYQVKPINDIDIFLNSIIKEDPSLVFVDMQLAEEMFSSSVWAEAWESLQKNKVTFCGVGKQLFNDKHTAQGGAVFNEVFVEPINVNKLHKFLHNEMLFNTLDKIDRRTEDRRIEDRRKQLIKQDEAQSTNASSLDHQQTPNNHSTLEKSLQIGSLNIDCLGKAISINDIPVDISPKEFEFITLLAEHPGRVVKTEDMIKMIWPENNRATKADVHQYLYMLRKKIEINPHHPKLLVTVKGFGYKLCP